MALREARLPIRFTGGLETEEDDKHVVLGSLLALENGVFVRPGTIGKRNGTAVVSRERLDSAEPLPAARATAKRAGELLAFDSHSGYSYSPSAGAWKGAGGIVCPKLSHSPMAARADEQTLADKASTAGISIYSWTETAGAFLAVYDAESGRCLLEPTLFLAGGTKTRAAVVGENLIAFAIDTASRRIWSAVVSIDNPSAEPTVAILMDSLHATHHNYDVFTGAERTAIAWVTETGYLRAGFVHQSGVMGSPATSLPSAVDITSGVTGGVAVGIGILNRVYFGYAEGSNVKVAIFEEDLDSSISFATLDTVTDPARLTIGANEEAVLLAWDYEDGDARVATWASLSDGQGGSIRASQVAGRPFYDEGHFFVPVVFESTLYTTLFVVRDDALTVARILPSQSGGAPVADCVPSVSSDGRIHSFAAIYRQRFDSANEDTFGERGIQDVSLDFGAEDSHQATQMGRTTYIAGAGFLWAYDGEGFVEHSFHYAPDDIEDPAQASPTGGPTTPGVDVGTHVYQFAYGWKNAQGEIEWGPVSAGTEVVVASSAKKVTFEAPTYRHTAKTDPRSEVFIGAFRSLSNEADELFRVSSLDPTATGSNGYIENDPTTDTVTFVDEMSDAVLVNQEGLYTNESILSNRPTPTASVVTSAKGRLFANDPEDPALIRHGQQRRDGYLAEISPLLQVRLDDFGGPVTSAVEQDGSIIAFRRRGVYRFAGAGPNGDNTGGFSDPQLVHTDVGSVDQRMVVPTPLGTFFKSEKGFRLIDRNLQAHYVGQPVAKYTDPAREPQSFTSAELLPDRNEVRLLASAGKSLHYDYRNNKWSEWKNYAGVAAEIVNGTYYYVRSDGDVMVETPGVYRDVNAHVPLAIETSWITFAQYLQSWQRLWTASLIGRYLSPHSLRFRAAFDYSERWEVDITKDTSDFVTLSPYGEGDYGEGPYGGSGDSRYQMEFHLDRECQAVKFRIEDVEAEGQYGASFELSEILVCGGVEATKATIAAERMG